jgi:hypothetical protein
LPKLWERQVVEPFSGARYFGEPYKVPGCDHFSIAKPDDNTKIQHRLLCTFILENALSPAQGVTPMPPSPPPSGALVIWQEKLSLLLEEEAKVVDADQKFRLRKLIEEAKATHPARRLRAGNVRRRRNGCDGAQSVRRYCG